MVCFFFILRQGGWQYGQELALDSPLYLQATTAYLGSIIVLQVVNVFLCRSTNRSVFSTGISGNPLILWGVLIEITLLLLVAYTPAGNVLFSTAPLESTAWLFLLPCAALLFCLEETRKGLVRIWRANKNSREMHSS
jgi:magnesium-transporting ATPase (P-type)